MLLLQLSCISVFQEKSLDELENCNFIGITTVTIRNAKVCFFLFLPVSSFLAHDDPFSRSAVALTCGGEQEKKNTTVQFSNIHTK